MSSKCGRNVIATHPGAGRLTPQVPQDPGIPEAPSMGRVVLSASVLSDAMFASNNTGRQSCSTARVTGSLGETHPEKTLLLNTFLKASSEAFKIIFQVLAAAAGAAGSRGVEGRPVVRSQKRSSCHSHLHFVVLTHRVAGYVNTFSEVRGGFEVLLQHV